MTKEDQNEYLGLIEASLYKKGGRPVHLVQHHPVYDKLLNEPTWAKFVFLSALYPEILNTSGEQTAFQKLMLSAFGSLQVDDKTQSYRSYHADPDRQESQESQQSREEQDERRKRQKRSSALLDESILMSQQEMSIMSQEGERGGISAFEAALRDRETGVTAREVAVAAREAAVGRREAALAVRETGMTPEDREIATATLNAVLRQEKIVEKLEPIIREARDQAREARDQARDGVSFILDLWEFHQTGEWPHVAD